MSNLQRQDASLGPPAPPRLASPLPLTCRLLEMLALESVHIRAALFTSRAQLEVLAWTPGKKEQSQPVQSSLGSQGKA